MYTPEGDFAGFPGDARQLGHMGLSRKRRRRAPRGWSEGLEDLHDYMQPQPTRASARGSVASAPIVVTDVWP